MMSAWNDDGHELVLAAQDDWSLRAKFICPLERGEPGPCRLKIENPEPRPEDDDEGWDDYEEWVDDPENAFCALIYANSEDRESLVLMPRKPHALVYPGQIMWAYEGGGEDWFLVIKNPPTERNWRIIRAGTDPLDFRGTPEEVQQKVEELGGGWASEMM